MEGLYVENKTSKPNTCGGEPQRATRVVKQVHGLFPPVSEKPGISHLGQALKTDGDERNRQGPGTTGSEGLGLRPGAPGTAASSARSSPLEPPFPKTPGVGLLPRHVSPCLGEYMWGGVWPLFQHIYSENWGSKAITPCQRPQQTRPGREVSPHLWEGRCQVKGCHLLTWLLCHGLCYFLLGNPPLSFFLHQFSHRVL